VIERVTSEPGTPYQLSCVLKYAVELAVNAKPSRFIDLMEPLIERIIAEDLPHSVLGAPGSLYLWRSAIIYV
jgi:hypothetical protein